jgi:diacylglycerol kinase family enzyme
MSRRLGAIVAILGGGVSLGVATYVFFADFPAGIVVLGCVVAALAVAWYGLLRRGARRMLATALVLILIGAAVAVMVANHNGLVLALVVASFAAGVAGGRVAFRPNRSLPPAPAPLHPVLFVNPHSGEGRAARTGLVEEAQLRGIETIEMGPEDDLEQLTRRAVERGADALAMAGGDGSQAVVATIAAEHGLPYVCIPSGTRNHFALELGVDREDVIGALEALTDGGERNVDLGEVNGRVFVNNVSLGVYAEAVNHEQYRGAKLRTLLDTLTDTLGAAGEGSELRWRDADGVEQRSKALLLISNNPYRLGRVLGSGTRPHMDRGVLGVVDVRPPAAAEESSATRARELVVEELQVEADGPVPAGIDGESVLLEPPLRFRIRPRALKVRIARIHPGASPSADLPANQVSVVKELFRLLNTR